MHSINRRGYGLVGVLVSMAIIVVLIAISMTAMNKAITGAGNTESGTVASMADKLMLQQIYQVLAMETMSSGGSLPTPSRISGSLDVRDNTTASLYSAMIAQRYVEPKSLISANENNPYIWDDKDYDYSKYAPVNGSYWDPNFSADLDRDANVSYAHMPIFGDRTTHWDKPRFATTVPMFGNRGPRNGVPDPSSYTYGKDGTWAGHAVFGDGHVEFFESFTPGSMMFYRNGVPEPDNIFAFDDGFTGGDAILTFTKMIDRMDIEVQHD
jgi:hypothetical protein